MSKPIARPTSRYTLEAAALLGRLVRLARIEKRMTAQELADRAGISRGLLQRIEKGDPRCQLGAAFEVAAILGIPLFGGDADDLAVQGRRAERVLALLPKSVHADAGTRDVGDDF